MTFTSSNSGSVSLTVTTSTGWPPDETAGVREPLPSPPPTLPASVKLELPCPSTR